MSRRSGVLSVPAGAVACILLGTMASACGQPATADPATQTPPSLAAPLQAWATFPVEASPRPIVLVGGVIVDPAGGFPDGNSKLDYLTGAFQTAVQLPAGPSTADGHPIMNAQSALTLLRSQEKMTGAKASPSSSHLTVTAVNLGERAFLTDRGERTYPAWLFSFAGVENPAGVLALPPNLLWPLPPVTNAQGPSVNGATLGPDGRTLRVGLTGYAAGSGPCTASYTLAFAESKTAAAVAVIEHFNAPPAGELCTLEGHVRTATATLHAPLGGRVLVDGRSAQAIVVTPVS